VNRERPSDATGQPPAILLEEEQLKLGPLPDGARDYGFFDSVVVSREGLVAPQSNRYSVPAHLIGRVLTARIHKSRIELFADCERVASHPRHTGQRARIIDPAHFEAVFARYPSGKSDGLPGLAVQFVAAGCFVRTGTLLQTTGRDEPADDCAV